MNTTYNIDTVPLPLNQDFEALKKNGFHYIQENSGSEWTNLNPNDPGVTILGQICYALTELGYCNDFDIADILTDPNGELLIEDQFYLPEQILTTAPVTIPDYIKYLVDGVDGVNNALIRPVEHSASLNSFVYEVYLYVDLSITDTEEISKICKAAFFYLNKSRNIGEVFLMPLALKICEYFIAGNIEIENKADLNEVAGQIQDKINEHIFPFVSRDGYDQLVELGKETNHIFNGPVLQNGWIQTASIGKKKDILRTIDLTKIIESIPGVIMVADVVFNLVSSVPDNNELQSIFCVKSTISEILSVNIIESILCSSLKIYQHGTALNTAVINQQLTLGKPALINNDSQLEPSINCKAKLPSGNFRDIDTYYSIQNTFPEIFAVGWDAIVADASDFQMAQSRQLKGYLTLFDQVLANQFSQLANIDKLFSFKNSLIPNPSEVKAFLDYKDAAVIKQEYPVPYKTFSPTYFYQALYNTPNIKPLLKNNDAFNFNDRNDAERLEEGKKWKAYKQNPYNPYTRGLMGMMEDEKNNLIRRNELLDHLLARHGELPYIIDTIIEGSIYAGVILKDKVIFKSLFLQNLCLLSYYRQKAYNFIGSNKIAEEIAEVPLRFEENILGIDSIDFIFNTLEIDKREKLTTSDFIQYAAIELQLSLLFGLKILYKNYISLNYEIPENTTNIKLAMWMISQRRGVFFIETGLLKLTDKFELLPADKDAQIPSVLDDEVQIILPDFIPQLNMDEFKVRLNLFLKYSMPVKVSYNISFIKNSQLEKFIPAYSKWYNSLVFVYNLANVVKNTGLANNAKTVTDLLTEICLRGK